MQKICSRRLTPTEPEASILTLGTKYKQLFPRPSARIIFIHENGQPAGEGKMHSQTPARIDGLAWWYNQHGAITAGMTIGVYKDENNRYMLKLEDASVEVVDNPPPDNSYEEDVTSFSIEKDLENYLIKNKNLNILEEGLYLVQPQYPIDYENKRWYIDILAKDKDSNLVVIELKAGIAKEGVCGQTSKYIAVVKKTHPDAKEKKVRGIIVANEFDTDLKLAISNMPDILLKKYNINFRFEDS